VEDEVHVSDHLIIGPNKEHAAGVSVFLPFFGAITSCPAVSQICSLMVLPSCSIVRILN